jgi:hypothetical protein
MNKPMRVWLFIPYLLIACTLYIFPGEAGADTMRVFDISGNFTSGATLSGTITIDPVIGEVVAVDILVDGEPSADYKQFELVQIDEQGSQGFAYVVYTSPRDDGWPKFIFGERSAPDSLRTYLGGPLGPLTVLKLSNGASGLLKGGFLTPVPAAPAGPT